VADVENPWGLPPDLAGYERLLRGQMAGLDPASPASQGRQTKKPCTMLFKSEAEPQLVMPFFYEF